MLKLLDDAGRVDLFPMVCPHCECTYWYAPNQSIRESAHGPISDECWRAMQAEGWPNNQGRLWWAELLREGIQRALEVVRKARREGQGVAQVEEQLEALVARHQVARPQGTG